MEISLNIPARAWGEHGTDENPKSRLMLEGGGLTINGHFFHVEAIQVVDREGLQEAAEATFARALNCLQEFSDSRLQTQRIGRRDYVIVVTPHGD